MTKKNDIEVIFKAHYSRLRRLALAIVRDDDISRDIVNDVFVSLLDRSATVVPTFAYLAAAVRNRSLNYLRDCDIRRRVVSLYFSEIDDYDAEQWPDEATVARIYDVIARELTPQYRRVMELRFSEGLTFAEVARRMDVSENTVYKRLRHALMIIRKNL